MKTKYFKNSRIILLLLSVLVSFSMQAQVGGWKAELCTDAENALAKMIEKTPKLQTYVDKAYGYVVFPKITKAALLVGGAGGKGIVYKEETTTGEATLSQASIGLQAGGQQYSEVIFFENKEAYNHFVNNKLKFDGQVSAVAITSGVSLDIAYKDGVAVFTMAEGGLMFEASVGGQHFKFKKK